MTTAKPTAKDGIAWITGASSGIGRAVALELVRRGWRVAATARREEDLRALAQEAAPGRVLVYPGDVTDRLAMAGLVERIENDTGPIALGFLCVGTYFPETSEHLVGDAFRKTFTVNLDGTFNALEPLIPRMKRR